MATMRSQQTRNPRRVLAFALVEVLITLVIAVVMLVGIITLLSFNFLYQNQQELRACAMDIMVSEMEELKQEFTVTLAPYTEALAVSDNRTPDNSDDDTRGRLQVQFFDRNGVALANKDEVRDALVPDGRIRVLMTVEWSGRGRQSGNIYREQLAGLLIP